VVASDIFGVFGRAMLAALIAGERDPKCSRSWHAAGCGPSSASLEEAFIGFVTDHHAFLLAKMLARVDALDVDIAELDGKLEELIVLSRR
jgi:transposase